MNRLPHSARILIAVAGAAMTTALLLEGKAGSIIDSSGSAPGTVAVAAGGLSGTFTGPVIDTHWGPVQVRITLTAGALSNVDALQTPDAHRKSVTINLRATPILRQEALKAQSADIDTVSGATVTSAAYRESLQAALDAAQG